MDTLLVWILLASFLMSLLSWSGLIILYVKKGSLDKIKMPLIAFSAGALLGGAFFHMIPESINRVGSSTDYFLCVVGGFALFFLMEQGINWHYYHHNKGEWDHKLPHKNKKGIEEGDQKQSDNEDSELQETNPTNISNQEKQNDSPKESFTYLILIADGLHNFIGGIAIASSFLISVEVGFITWIAAAAHEIPQELGDFGILVHGGWKKKKAFLLNFISALTIVPGALLVYFSTENLSTGMMLAFAAGNFIYLSASDLLPEITHGQAHDKASKPKATHEIIRKGMVNFALFVLGLALIILTRLAFHK